MKSDNNNIENLLTRRVDSIVGEKELRAKLMAGKKLRIKHGVDPTTTDLHIGHAVTYQKMREFQDLGHTIIFLIGDFTARFGDPTDQLFCNHGRIRGLLDVQQQADKFITTPATDHVLATHGSGQALGHRQ